MPTFNFKTFKAPAKRTRGAALKVVMGIGLLAITVGLGSTLAANINLNTGSAVEFGQGVAETTACDSQIMVTPQSTFVNASGAGAFQLATLQISDIANACQGKRFEINIFGDSSMPLNSAGKITVDYVTSGGNAFTLISDSSHATITTMNFATTDPGLGAAGNTSELGASLFVLSNISDSSGSPLLAEDVKRVSVETSVNPSATPSASSSSTPTPSASGCPSYGGSASITLSNQSPSVNWFAVDASTVAAAACALSGSVQYAYYESNSLIDAADQSTWPTAIDISSGYVDSQTGMGAFNPSFKYHLIVATILNSSSQSVGTVISNVLYDPTRT